MGYSTPVLIVAWRRPHTLRRVIDSIRMVAPNRVFLACDGPNLKRAGEAEKVAATQALLEQAIDWPCQVERLYSDTNQGCRIGVSRAITWFFEHVEEGIILEDDCVPHPDFFQYCSILLEHYRYDQRVWCISGSNFQHGQWRGDGSYYFSRYNHCWGWASWRRCWQHYDINISLWPSLRHSKLLETIFEDPLERYYWGSIWQRLLEEEQPNTWDYQWTFTCLMNGGLTALPNRNLISNIGFGSDATHTISTVNSIIAKEGLKDIIHPSFILRDTVADIYTFKNYFGPQKLLPWLKLSLRCSLERLKYGLK